MKAFSPILKTDKNSNQMSIFFLLAKKKHQNRIGLNEAFKVARTEIINEMHWKGKLNSSQNEALCCDRLIYSLKRTREDNQKCPAPNRLLSWKTHFCYITDHFGQVNMVFTVLTCYIRCVLCYTLVFSVGSLMFILSRQLHLSLKRVS